MEAHRLGFEEAATLLAQLGRRAEVDHAAEAELLTQPLDVGGR